MLSAKDTKNTVNKTQMEKKTPPETKNSVYFCLYNPNPVIINLSQPVSSLLIQLYSMLSSFNQALSPLLTLHFLFSHCLTTMGNYIIKLLIIQNFKTFYGSGINMYLIFDKNVMIRYDMHI